MSKFTQLYPEWISLYLSGKSTVEIAKAYDTSHKVVWAALKRNNVEMRPAAKFGKVHKEWIDLYVSGWSLGKIADKYGTDAANVLYTLKKHGVERRDIPEHARHEELMPFHAEWAKLYKNGMSANDIAKKYNMDDTTVWRAIQGAGVETRSAGLAHRKYFVKNNSAFDQIDTFEKAYWLGFLMADGNLYKATKGAETSLQVNLGKVDIGHIEKLKVFLDTDAPIHMVEKTNAACFSVSSESLANGLIKWGCIPKKSLVLQFPNIPGEFYAPFVLGYFDGDGSVFQVSKTANKYGIRVNFCSGSCDFMERMQIILLNAARISTTPLQKRKNSNIYLFNIERKADVRKIYEWFYSGATVYLDRKKKKFDELINNKGF